VWQDDIVSEANQQRGGASVPATAEESADSVTAASVIPGLRQVSEVETLKALADPIRLRILAALMRIEDDPVVMSVKELAEQLGEPQTKLYRHVKLLESAGLIRVAATRLVSGILEHRYQASQRDLMFAPGLLRDSATTDQLEAAFGTIVQLFGEQFFAAVREGRVGSGEFPPELAYRRHLLMMSETRISASRAAAIRLKLEEVQEEMDAAEDPDGVPVSLLIGFYSPAESAPDQPGSAEATPR
jgi:DNA-binding transcriptional ArsR family regulator